MAENSSEVPAAIARLEGVTEMDFKVAEVTVTETAGLLTPLRAAVICAEPGARPRTRPAPTLAMPFCEEVHVALGVTFCFVPSLKVPVATTWIVPFLAMDALAGVTAMD